jgi:hypothetical protein
MAKRKLIQPAFHKANLSCWLIPFKTILAELKILNWKTDGCFPVLMIYFQTVIKSIFNINISGADIDSLQHTTEATQKMLVQELRQPFFVWWFNLSGKTKSI